MRSTDQQVDVGAELQHRHCSAFSLARLRFYVIATTPIDLPAGYKGSAFRGAFGHALKKLSPRFYDLFFKPSSPAIGNPRNSVPTPFVLVPPLEEKSQWAAGEAFAFELILFGYFTAQLPICVAAIERLGKSMGLGNNRGHFAIQHIEARSPTGEIDSVLGENGALAPLQSHDAMDFSPRLEAIPTAVMLRLETRLRLIHNNQLVREAPAFSVFFQRLLGRLKNLSDLYGSAPLFDAEQKQRLLNEAENVAIERHTIEWCDWPRYSGRQKEWMKFGGLLGSITYQGDMRPFLPWLALGEWTHLGKQTRFGLGKYVMEIKT